MEKYNVEYIYIKGKFYPVRCWTECKGLNDWIKLVITKNKCTFMGYENRRQCAELVYHGIIVKVDDDGGLLLSLHDYMKYQNNPKPFLDAGPTTHLVWNINNGALSKQGYATSTRSLDCVIPIDDPEMHEMMSLLTKWS